MITAVVSKKGGVGKTTTAVSLAAALAGIGRRVLLVDLDSQASASLSLGVPRSELGPSSADALLGSMPFGRVVRRTRIAGLDLVTASADLSSAEKFLVAQPRAETRLRTALHSISNFYDFVLIDCPSSLSLLPLNALVAADNFIIPVVPHFLAIEGLRNVLSLTARLYERFGTRTALLGIVLTMVDYRTRTNRDNVESIRREFGAMVFAIEIRTNIRLAEAPASGRTIFEFDGESTGAKAYRLLAAETLIRSRTAAAALRAEPEARALRS